MKKIAEIVEGRLAEIRKEPKWSQERRLEFIDFRLQWEGRLSRADLTSFFGISIPQASLDIARYLELAPENLIYDRGLRIYLAAQGFKPLYTTSGPQRYLNELLASEAGIVATESSFIGWRPDVAVMPIPGRLINAGILTLLTTAIRSKSTLQVLYQSLSSPEPSIRKIAPHALAHDGFRWHVRAYCFTRKRFIDFLIARMLSVETADSAEMDSSEDKEWHTLIRLILTPHPQLSPAHKKAIELDYGMVNGEIALECRHALLFYVLKRLGLNEKEVRRPEDQQIVLKNTDEVERYIQLLKIN